MLNPLTLRLATPAALVVLSYSYAKRFTWLGHLHLGAALGIAPVGAWVAVRGHVDAAPLCLGAAVMCWVAGFDIIYSCQDVAFDRCFGLHSIPARFGIGPALRAAAALHALTVLFLIRQRAEKRGTVSGYLSRIPTARKLDLYAYRFMAFAFPVTLAVFFLSIFKTARARRMVAMATSPLG